MRGASEATSPRVAGWGHSETTLWKVCRRELSLSNLRFRPPQGRPLAAFSRLFRRLSRYNLPH